MAEDPEGKDRIKAEVEKVLLDEQRACLDEDQGEEVSKWGDLKWFPDHDEGGLWIMEIFQYKCGKIRPLRSYRSNSLNALIEHGKKVCDEVEAFFRIRPDEKTMAGKVEARDRAYQRPKDCFEHGPHHGVCEECKSDQEAVTDVAKEMGFKDKP